MSVATKIARCLLQSSLALSILSPSATRAADDPLADQVAEYKKSGEPIEPADFDITGVADADNAALELRKAGDALDTKSAAWTEYDSWPTVALPLTDAQVATLRTVASENAKAIEHLDLAMTRKSIDWQIKMTSPVIEVALPHLGLEPDVSDMLRAHALFRHQQGDDAGALRDVKRTIFVSCAIGHRGSLVGHLVSLSAMRRASNALEIVLPDLRIGPDAAPPQDVKDLITSLLDDKPSRLAMREAVLQERMFDLDTARCVIDGRIDVAKLVSDPKVTLPVISKDMAQPDGLLAIRHCTSVVKAFDETSDLPTLLQRLPPKPKEIDADPQAHALAKVMLPSFDRALVTHYRVLTERRLMAVALAVRAYTSAHDGQAPQQLSDLVPEYFPKVPDDPLAAGQSVKYVAAKSIVYSTGEDGKDDGGDDTPVDKAKDFSRWDRRDAVVHLQRQPRK